MESACLKFCTARVNWFSKQKERDLKEIPNAFEVIDNGKKQFSWIVKYN
jgi:hypothetical protein